jgi:hypothetical protein
MYRHVMRTYTIRDFNGLSSTIAEAMGRPKAVQYALSLNKMTPVVVDESYSGVPLTVNPPFLPIGVVF